MINLKIKFSKFICIFISLYSINVSSEENTLIDTVEKNWNNAQTISGRFHQKLDDGNIISGNFYIQKPYKSYFIYDNGLENIITSKFFINIVDEKKYLIDKYPIINQPIYKILSERISFKKIFKVLSIKTIDNKIAINLISKSDSSNNKTKIKLIFDKDDYSLKNWEIINDLGQSTYLEFTKVRKNISIDQKLFIIKQ